MIEVYEAWFGIRRRSGILIDPDDAFAEFTLLEALKLQTKWKSGLRFLHPRTIQLPDFDPWA